MQLWVKICSTCTEVSHKCILSMPKQVLLWRERFLCVYEPVIPAVRIRNDVTMRALARCESMERREKLFLVFHFEKGRRKEKKRSWCRDVYPDDACSFRTYKFHRSHITNLDEQMSETSGAFLHQILLTNPCTYTMFCS